MCQLPDSGTPVTGAMAVHRAYLYLVFLVACQSADHVAA